MSAWCDGKIRRYGTSYACGQHASYAVRSDGVVIGGTCRHHLAQVVDSADVVKVEVIVLKDN